MDVEAVFLAFAAFSHNANMLTPFFFIYIARIKNTIESIRKGNLECGFRVFLLPC
jgi:hypothetical protein